MTGINSLDTTKITDEARKELREAAIKQFDRLGELGVINMLAVPMDNSESFVIGVPGNNGHSELYEVDLSQLVAFTLGATAALEIVSLAVKSAKTTRGKRG